MLSPLPSKLGRVPQHFANPTFIGSNHPCGLHHRFALQECERPTGHHPPQTLFHQQSSLQILRQDRANLHGPKHASAALPHRLALHTTKQGFVLHCRVLAVQRVPGPILWGQVHLLQVRRPAGRPGALGLVDELEVQGVPQLQLHEPRFMLHLQSPQVGPLADAGLSVDGLNGIDCLLSRGVCVWGGGVPSNFELVSKWASSPLPPFKKHSLS